MKLRALAVCIGAGAILLLAACTSDDTATTSPTDEPTATPAPEPAVNAAASAYVDDVMGWFDQGQRISSGVSEVSLSANPFSASNLAKALRLTEDADDWRDDALAFNAPPEFDEVQMWIELAGVTMADAVKDFWLGVTLVDADLIISATEKTTTTNGYIDNATEAIGRLD